MSLRLENVYFGYDEAEARILVDASATFGMGWTGLIGVNGCGKTTFLKLICGKLKPNSGAIVGNGGKISYCEQTTTEPAAWRDLCDAYDRDAIEVKTRLALHDSSTDDWHRLSEGYKKRWQIACALWQRPDILLIDEPANHLDVTNKSILQTALADFSGIGIIISHQRDLLNRLCRQCIFLVDGHLHVYRGSYADSLLAFQQDEQNLLKQRSLSKQEISRLGQELGRVKRENSKSNRRLSKRSLGKHDHDAKTKIDRARLTGKDKSLSGKQRQLERRIEGKKSESEGHSIRKSYDGPIFFERPQPRPGFEFYLDKGTIPLPNGSRLTHPRLEIHRTAKIGIRGPNGFGKSSLLKHLIETTIPATSYFYLPQELMERDTAATQKEFLQGDNESKSKILQIVARLGSTSKRILESPKWSPGETRKVMIATAIVAGHNFLILDEPTNHLDLHSIELLEAALKESSLTLMMVSHDHDFLQNVCDQVWDLGTTPAGSTLSITILE